MSDYVINPITSTLDAVKSTTELNAALDTRYLQLSGGTMTGAINSLSVIPTVDSASDLGSSSKYFATAYTDKIYLNSTATLDGSVAGAISIVGKLSTLSNGNLSLVPNGTGYTIIGDAGTTSHSFNTNDDLLVSGRLEVDGLAYFDNRLLVEFAGTDTTAMSIDARSSSVNNSPAFIVILPTTGAQKAFQLKNGTDTFAWASFEYSIGGASKAGLAIGPGGGSARDVNLYRDSANVLKTDDAFVATGNISTSGVFNVDGVQVVSNRVVDARIDDAINSGDATTDGVIDAIVDCLIAHGLIAAA